MKKIYSLGCILLLAWNAAAQIACKRDTLLMGSRFDVTIAAADSLTAERHINQVIDEIVRIEQLISDWKPDSQISEINRNAGIRPVKVSREVFDLTKRAVFFSEITDGAFDISSAAMERIWKFDGSMERLPSQEQLLKAIEKVGYQHIILNEKDTTVYLEKAGMKIGFGATGKGYAADRGRAVMQQLGVQAGIVNASGDLAAWGTQPDGSPWKIGITHPFKRGTYAGIIALTNGAVTTSGDYEKFILIEGKRYAHIINPKTGMPATGLTSATVVGPSAEMANGFSTSLMVLGSKKGRALLRSYPEYACLLITDSGKIRTSKNYRKQVKNR